MIRLDEGLIVFDAALEARDYWLAVEVLAGQPKTPDTQNRWRSLGAKALEQGVLVWLKTWANTDTLYTEQDLQDLAQYLQDLEQD